VTRPTARLFALGAAILLALPLARAADSTPGPLSRFEAMTGWLLLFDGDSLFGWTPRGEIPWEAAEGLLRPARDTGPCTLAATTEFADFELHLDFQLEGGADWRLGLRCPAESSVPSDTGTIFNLTRLVETADPPPAAAAGWHTLQVVYQADQFKATLNGQPLGKGRDRKHARGSIALSRAGGQGVARFRNIKLRPLNLLSLFNGKDLTGWKVMPDHPSVYSVTPQGWLNVKNGNGDLQTEKTFGDFVLQLEIVSHGEHLNSGVFFRAIPGEFWQGYESQIRNQWEGDDRSKPVDFGTGGIYRRQPARRVVSNDREWFTKTIVAHGPHFAVWVNGYQVSDWTDSRPAHVNPREGYRAQPGVVSLQGHDPTTDLSFRNLRLAVFPPHSAGTKR